MKKLIILNIVLSLISINCWADTPLITNPKQIKDSVKESIVSNTTSYNILKSSINRLNTDLQSFKNDVRISTNSINTDLQNYKINVRTSTNSINIDLQNFKNDVRTSTNNIITDLQNFKTEVSTTYVRKDGDTINGNLTVNGIFGVGSMGVWTAGGITSLGDVKGNRLCINDNCISEWGNGGSGGGSGSGRGFDFYYFDDNTGYGEISSGRDGMYNWQYIFFGSTNPFILTGNIPYIKYNIYRHSPYEGAASYIKFGEAPYDIAVSSIQDAGNRYSWIKYEGTHLDIYNYNKLYDNTENRSRITLHGDGGIGLEGKGVDIWGYNGIWISAGHTVGYGWIEIGQYGVILSSNVCVGCRYNSDGKGLRLSPTNIMFEDTFNSITHSISVDNGLNLYSPHSVDLTTEGTIDATANTRIVLNATQGDIQINANDGVFINQGGLWVGTESVRNVYICDGGTLDGILVSNSYKCVGGVAKRTKLYLSVE